MSLHCHDLRRLLLLVECPYYSNAVDDSEAHCELQKQKQLKSQRRHFQRVRRREVPLRQASAFVPSSKSRVTLLAHSLSFLGWCRRRQEGALYLSKVRACLPKSGSGSAWDKVRCALPKTGQVCDWTSGFSSEVCSLVRRSANEALGNDVSCLWRGHGIATYAYTSSM
jgi:hypothetical protein